MKLSQEDQKVQTLADCAELAIFTSELAQGIAYTKMSEADVKRIARRIDALSRAIADKIDSTADILFQKVTVVHKVTS